MRDAEKPAVVYAQMGNKRSRFAGSFTGATGLEPATSGVTDQFVGRHVNNDGCPITLFVRSFRAVSEQLARLSGAVPGVCCPIAARIDPSVP